MSSRREAGHFSLDIPFYRITYVRVPDFTAVTGSNPVGDAHSLFVPELFQHREKRRVRGVQNPAPPTNACMGGLVTSIAKFAFFYIVYDQAGL
jgi:hypothetical protein